MNQHNTIITHIKKAGSISRREAMIDYSISNITARMSELRQMGYKVVTHMKKHPTTGQNYMRYSLAK